MAYEFNPNAKRFEVPNPHRVENLFLLTGGSALVLAGLAGLVAARNHIGNDAVGGSAGVLIGAAVFAAGLYVLASVLRQLKFYFGRDQPLSFGQSRSQYAPTAENVRSWIRQNAIDYQIPHSGIDQLLYALIPNLVFSPMPLQHVARAQFRNLLVFAAIIVSAVVALLGVTGNAKGWIALIYFGLSAFIVLRTWLRPGVGATEMSVPLLVLLAVGSIVGPILLSMTGIGAVPFAKSIAWIWQATLAIGATTCSAGLLLFAVTRHVIVPNSIAMSNHTQKVSFNGSPDQLYVELDRQLQASWTEQIPNRRYVRSEPIIQGERGSFTGEVMEESQPIPTDTETPSVAECWESKQYQPLILVDCVILILLIAAAVIGYMSAARGGKGAANLLLAGFTCWAVAMYTFKSSKFLWRRFRFVSRVYWVEMQGNFQQASVDFGNVLQDRLKTRKQVINVEDMTLRTWVAELDSICYGRDEERWVVGFAGAPQAAQQLGESLAAHLREGSIIVAPTSPGDLQRAAQAAALNGLNSSQLPGNAQSSAAALLASQSIDDQLKE